MAVIALSVFTLYETKLRTCHLYLCAV